MKKIIIILISISSSFIIMSSGYGLWQKDITVEGDIEVVSDPEIIEILQTEIDNKYQEIERLLEEQKIQEEQRKLQEEKKEAETQSEEVAIPPADEEVSSMENNNKSEVEISSEDENSDYISDNIEDNGL